VSPLWRSKAGAALGGERLRSGPEAQIPIRLRWPTALRWPNRRTFSSAVQPPQDFLFSLSSSLYLASQTVTNDHHCYQSPTHRLLVFLCRKHLPPTPIANFYISVAPFILTIRWSKCASILRRPRSHPSSESLLQRHVVPSSCANPFLPITTPAIDVLTTLARGLIEGRETSPAPTSACWPPWSNSEILPTSRSICASQRWDEGRLKLRPLRMTGIDQCRSSSCLPQGAAHK
jgi:hypothetical protein